MVRNLNCPPFITPAVYALLKKENSKAPANISTDLMDQLVVVLHEILVLSGEREGKKNMNEESFQTDTDTEMNSLGVMRS